MSFLDGITTTGGNTSMLFRLPSFINNNRLKVMFLMKIQWASAQRPKQNDYYTRVGYRF